MGSAYKAKHLETKYPKEWDAIHEEYYPGFTEKRRKKELKEKAQERKEMLKEKQEERREAEQSSSTWKSIKKG